MAMPRSAAFDPVLQGQERRLHHEADPGAEHRGERGCDTDRGPEPQRREERDADGHEQRARDRPPAVPAGALDPSSRHQRGQRGCAHERDEQETGLRRADPADLLEEHGEEEDAAVEEEAAREVEPVHDAHDCVREEADGDEGLGRVTFAAHEQRGEHDHRRQQRGRLG